MFQVEKTFYIEEVDVAEKDITVEQDNPSDESSSEEDSNLRVCPKCSKNTLKIENGCNSCINPDCGYGKCDI